MAQLHNPLSADTHDAIEMIQFIFVGEQGTLYPPVLCEAGACDAQAVDESSRCLRHTYERGC